MKSNFSNYFNVTKSLFVLLENDRPEISLSGIHVLLLTNYFYNQLPFHYKIHIDLDQLRYGALLHDIGKIKIPKDILNKPGKLEPEEMELVKSHARISGEMLKKIPGLEPLAAWVPYHHERMDGMGYYHLQGEEIPIEARIIAITDTYSSIIMASSFKPSRTHEDAVSILKMSAGTQFDTELVNIFCSVPHNCLSEATDEAIQIMEDMKIG